MAQQMQASDPRLMETLRNAMQGNIVAGDAASKQESNGNAEKPPEN